MTKEAYRRLFGHVALSSLSRIVYIVCQFTFLLLIARFYDPSEVGTYSLLVSLVTPVIAFALLDASIFFVAKEGFKEHLFDLLWLPFLIGFLSLSISYFFLNNIEWLVLTGVFFIKIGESFGELYNSYLRSKARFKSFFAYVSLRSIGVYGLGALAVYSDLELKFVLLYMAITSVLLAFISTFLLTLDAKLKLSFDEPFSYVKRNFSIGIGTGTKLAATNLPKYYISFIYGVETLGHLVPVFFFLTTLSIAGTVIDNVVSPKFSKIISNSDSFIKAVNSIRPELVFIVVIYICMIFGTLFLSQWYYHFFFPKLEQTYSNLLVYLAMGWIFLLFKSIFKVSTYALNLSHLEFQNQLFSILILSSCIFTFDHFFGVEGVIIALSVSTLLSTFIYYNRINKALKRK